MTEALETQIRIVFAFERKDVSTFFYDQQQNNKRKQADGI